MPTEAGDWKTIPLEDCMETIIDYRGKSPQKTSFGIPLVTAKIVKGGRIDYTNLEYISVDDYDSWMRRGLPQDGDVVMTTEAPLGEIAQLDGRRVALAQRLIALRGKPDLLDNTFLKFFMQSDFVQDQLHARATGTTVLGIRQSELRKITLLVPPIDEQRTIAHILGTLDDKIEVNRRMNETLEAMARALFKSWFVDFDPVRAKAEGRQPAGMDAATAAFFPDSFEDSPLGEIPRGWRVSTIGECVRVVGGSTPSTKNLAFWDGGSINWATPKDLAGLASPVLINTERRITDLGLQQIGSGLLPQGTVLMSSRAPIGYLAIADIPTAINQGFIAMVCDDRLPNQYVLHWARSSMDVIEGRANGTTFLEISKANFRPMQVVVPAPSVLHAFTDRINTLFDAVTTALHESRMLAEARDLLLPRLLSGQFRASETVTGQGDITWRRPERPS